MANGFTPNMGLKQVPQGTIRFDESITRNVDTLDLIFDGSDSNTLGLGSKSRAVTSLRALGVEHLRIGSNVVEVPDNRTLQLGTFGGAGALGQTRRNANLLEWHNGTRFNRVFEGSDATVVQVLSEASGSRTVYTVPAGKVAVFGPFGWHDVATTADVHIVPSAGSVVVGNRIHAGAYDTGEAMHVLGHVMTAGEFVVVDSASSIAFFARVFEFDDTSDVASTFVPVFASEVTTITTVYTCPAGKVAQTGQYHGVMTADGMSAFTVSFGVYVHDASGSGSTVTVTLDDGTDRVIGSFTVAANKTTRHFISWFWLTLNPGDEIKITATASSNVFAVIQEVPA